MQFSYFRNSFKFKEFFYSVCSSSIEKKIRFLKLGWAWLCEWFMCVCGVNFNNNYNLIKDGERFEKV